jgi:ankyrin repeat protein
MDPQLQTEFNWESPLTYQMLMNGKEGAQNEEAVKKQLETPSSQKTLDVFIEAMSNKDWLKEHSKESLKGLKLIPARDVTSRCKLIKAIAAAGKLELVSSEANRMLKKVCKAKDWDLAIELLSMTGAVSIDSQKNTALHLIASDGTVEHLTRACQSLRQRGDSLDVHNWLRKTPLHIATEENKPEHVRLLLELGANIDAKDIGDMTALLKACQIGNIQILNLLLELNANSRIKGRQGQTPLLCAADSYSASPEVVSRLIELGENIEAKDKNDMTPLLMICSRGKEQDDLFKKDQRYQIAKILLDAGANVFVSNKRGETPLSYAVDSDNHLIVKLLIQNGADVNTLTFDELPILYKAHSPQISKLLTDAGALDDGAAGEILERKLLAHRFGLSGKTQLKEQSFKLEGFWSFESTVANLHSSVERYYEKLSSALTTKNDELWKYILAGLSPSTAAKVTALPKEKLIEILDNTANAIAASCSKSSAELMKIHAQGLPIGIVTGWTGHCTTMALDGDRLARCNKGGGSGDTPGILIHTIGKHDHLESALEYCISKSTQYFFTETIVEYLALSDQIYLPQRVQKVGNCVVANTNGMELALLYLQFIKLEPLIDHDAAEEFARAIQKGRTKDTKIGSVEDYLKWHSESCKYPPDLALLNQIYHKKFSNPSIEQQIKQLIEQWADKRGVSKDEIFSTRSP